MFLKEEGKDFELNFYRYKLYNDNQYLLTTDDANHIFLNKESFNKLKSGKIDSEELYDKLIKIGIIINEENFEQIVQNTRKRYSFLTNGTSLHIVIPTSRCNLGCKYCFAQPDSIDANKEETDLDVKTAKKIVEFIMQSHSNAITIEFQGGEATARYDLVKLMTNHAKELNKKYQKDLRLTIVSNLTLMNDEMINWFVDNDVTICTSLDGPKEVHDANRIIHIKDGKEVGTYESVIKGINKINRLCKEKKKTWKCGALMTITKNSLEYPKEIIDEYIKLDLNLVDIRSLTHVGEAIEENNKPFLYSKSEFEKFYTESMKYIEELKEKGIEINERTKQLYETKILERVPSYHTDYESPCGAATGQIVYHSNGDIYTCHEALGRDEFNLGNVYKDNWDSIFNKQETAKAILNSMLESNVKCDRCVFKPYCGTCMVENFYNFKKFNFYPTKTSKHHETISQCTKIFDKLLEKELAN